MRASWRRVAGLLALLVLSGCEGYHWQPSAPDDFNNGAYRDGDFTFNPSGGPGGDGFQAPF